MSEQERDQHSLSDADIERAAKQREDVLRNVLYQAKALVEELDGAEADEVTMPAEKIRNLGAAVILMYKQMDEKIAVEEMPTHPKDKGNQGFGCDYLLSGSVPDTGDWFRD